MMNKGEYSVELTSGKVVICEMMGFHFKIYKISMTPSQF